MKWHLVLLIVGALLPVVLFAGVVVQRLSTQEREATERRTQQAAETLAETVEREIAGTARTLQVLAESDNLDAGNLSAFYTEARRAAQTQPTWLSVLLLSPDGRKLLSSSRPLGAVLGPTSEPDSFKRVIETQQPTAGDLAVGENGILAFPVRVPVMRDGKLKYVLTAAITPKALANLLTEQSAVDGEWTRTVVDGKGIVVARTRNPERFVGQRGTAPFLARIQASPQGVYRDTTLEGAQVYVAFSRLDDSSWTAAVTVPVKVVEGPARRAMGLVIGTGLGLLLVSGIGAFLLSWRISNSIAQTAEAAEALARGEHPQLPASDIEEVVLLRSSLDNSARLLEERNRERDENLAKVEAARLEAEATSRLKDEFLITASHELRTPLNAILGWVTLLRGGNLDAARASRAIETIERNARAQARLVEDLLDTSRIVTGKLRLETQLINMASVVVNALDSVRHSAEEKNIRLTFQRPDYESPVMGDPNRLQQIVWNLLSNAIKFTPQGGQVEATVSSAHGWVTVAVRDTGMGIEPAFLPYVFDRFRQADGSTTRTFGGLGLGLAIVRHLVELHGGQVEADSSGENQGATFRVKLPLAATPSDSRVPVPPPAEAAVSTEAALPLLGVRVLVVDDEPDARELVATVLSQHGADVRTCRSAAEALRQVKDWYPAVLLSDIGMAGEDGYSLIRQVRQWEQTTGGMIPAAAITAFTREEDQRRALASGFQMHIAKPIEPEDLPTVVTQLLKEYSTASAGNLTPNVTRETADISDLGS